MSKDRPTQLESLLLDLLPADHGAIGNMALLERFLQAAQAAGVQPRRHRGRLQGRARKPGRVGPGRQGQGPRRLHRPRHRRRRARHRRREAGLRAESAHHRRRTPLAAPAPKPPKAKAAPARPAPGDPQVLAYRYADRRVNNPEVGLVSLETDPEQPKTRWAYDPHLDPALQFDSARAKAESR